MTDVFLERDFDPPITADEVLEMAADADWCFKAHRVAWRGSFLAIGGRKMLCWFHGADTESVRIALEGADLATIWPGTVYEGAAGVEPNVVVARRFAAPAVYAEVAALGQAHSACFQTHRVEYARTLCSLDRKRMLCFYRAPDAESVRIAQREAGMPVEAVWPFTRIGPDALPSDRA